MVPTLTGRLVGVVPPVLGVKRGPMPRSEVPGLTRLAFLGPCAAPAFPVVFLIGILALKCVWGGGQKFA
jgi:hypothetical protein